MPYTEDNEILKKYTYNFITLHQDLERSDEFLLHLIHKYVQCDFCQ